MLLFSTFKKENTGEMKLKYSPSKCQTNSIVRKPKRKFVKSSFSYVFWTILQQNAVRTHPARH